MKVVEIIWLDAWVESDSMTVKRAQKSEPVKTHTIGYLIAENEHGVTIATDLYEKDPKHAKIINFIPHGMIAEYWEWKD